MLNKVCVLTVQVTNLEEAIRFYTEVLKFQVNKRYGEKIVSLVQDIPLILEETETVTLNNSQPVLLGLLSENLDEDIKYLTGKGVKILFDEPKPCPPGRYTIIEDPSGNQIELVEFSA